MEAAAVAPQWLQYGSFGVLVLALVWGARYAIPKALELHERTIGRLVEDFRAELKEARATFSSEMHETRTQFAEELEKRDAAIEKLANAVDRISERVSPT